MEYQIICPHCKKTISNGSAIGSEGKEAGLASTFVYCECGNKLTFSVIISKLSEQKNLEQESKNDFIDLPWLEAGIGMP
jgi:RNase P subunit RPR2